MATLKIPFSNQLILLGRRFITRALLLLALIIPAAGLNAQTQVLDRVVAIVDNDVIMESELIQRLASINRNIEEQGGGRSAPEPQVLRQQVLERLISENLQLQMAERAGVKIEDAALNEALGNIAKQNNMDLTQFREKLERDGFSYQFMREQVRREMLLQRVQRGNVSHRVQVTDQEINNFLESETGKNKLTASYHILHLLLPLASDADAATITAAQNYMELLQQEAQRYNSFPALVSKPPQDRFGLSGSDLGWRKTTEMPAIFTDVISQLKVGETSQPVRSPSGFHLIQIVQTRGGEGQIVDQTSVRHILIKPSEIRSDEQAQKLATELYERAVAGEEFADLAREYSEDIGSAQEGGELGWAVKGQMVPQFDQVMAATAIGEFSKPFKTSFGWHFLQVLDRRQYDASSDLRRNQARNILYGRKYEEELQIWLQKIRDEAFVDIKY